MWYIYPDDNVVEEFVDCGAFELGLAGVLHEFGVLTGEDNYTVTPLRVA